MSKEVELTLLWKGSTEAAYLVTSDETDPGCDVWLAKSQVDLDEDAKQGDVCVFLVPEWLAIEKGLV